MREFEFKEWLSSRLWNGQPLAKTAKNSRIGWLKALERSLPALGFEYTDLDQVHGSGKWPELIEFIRSLANDWQLNAAASRSLAPQAENPRGQISNVLAVARLYGHFADGRDPNYDFRMGDERGQFSTAMEALREIFLERLYDFERMSDEEGRYWDVEKSYKQAARLEVQALSGRPDWSAEERGKAMYERLCQSTIQGLPLSWRTRAEVLKAPAEVRDRFYRTIVQLADDKRDIAELAEEGAHALEKLRQAGIPGLKRGEVLNIVLSVLGSLRPNESCWFKISMFDRAALKLLGKRLFPSPHFVRAEFEEFQRLLFRIRATLEEWEWEPETLEDVQGFLWVAMDDAWDVDYGPFPEPDAVDAAMAEYDEFKPEGFAKRHPGFGTPRDYWVRGKGERSSTIYPSKPIAAVAMGWLQINGGWSQPDSAASLLHRAGFVIVDANGRPVAVPNKPYLVAHEELVSEVDELMDVASAATNLILYGPPGTGKTWSTTAEAVRLCDRLAPDHPLLHDAALRTKLRERYDQLIVAGQVRLVTFHQSYSYEDFVEGLRPVTDGGSDDEAAAQTAGFRLEAKRGIFREICAIADDARKNAGRRGGYSLEGRKLFKMSLGRVGLEDHIFDAAIEGKYVVLGWGGDIDWSNPRYAEWSAMLERWREENPQATGNDPNVVQMWPFRSGMKTGDIVIVSAGNSHFRAVGEVTGPYRFDPTEVQTYNHRRAVRWLLVPDEPLPVDMIYGKNFMMQSCYQLKDSLVKKEALSRLLPGNDAPGDGAPDQFVLIIDEINRANISKVFGELITLIEPDKRLGAGPEALSVKLPYSGESFGIPANLHLVGTMNTADRSIALLDTALRRRFVFREIEPDPTLLPEEIDNVPLRRVLEVINDRIEYLVDREHRVGHAFFLGDGSKNRDAIDRTMRDKVIPLLQEYFFEDWSRVAAVLGERPGKGGAFLDCRQLKDPTGQNGEDRESWSVRPQFASDAYGRLIGKPIPGPIEQDVASALNEEPE